MTCGWICKRRENKTIGKHDRPEPKKPETDYTAALTQANQPNPAQSKLQEMSLNDLNFYSAGDYRNPKGHLMLNYADPSFRARQRELEMTGKPQGIYGLAGKSANPTALAIARENINAHNAEDDARQYEQDIKEGFAQAYGTAGDAANMEQARRLGILGITSGPYQAQLSRPKSPNWFSQLLGGAAAAAPMAFGA